LFTGGVESTALLTKASIGDTLLSIDPAFPNDRVTYKKSTSEKIAKYFGHKVQYAQMVIPTEPLPYTFVHQMRVFVSVANLWVAKTPQITEVWCGRNSAEPGVLLKPFIEQMMAAWAVLHPNVQFLHPLDHLSKRQQWELIPPDVKPFLSSCVYHTLCGRCHKCMEWVCLSESSPSNT
jgi:7-cyano-7-deazaguanine synthase in queuosine biosynthesis